MAQHNVSFRQGEVVGVDTGRAPITFADGRRLDFDYLVIASGATTNYFGTKGAEQNSLAIYTRAQALTLRDKIFTNLEHTAASATTDEADHRRRRGRADRRRDGRRTGRAAQRRADRDLSRTRPAAHPHRAGRDGRHRPGRRSRRSCASSPPRPCESAGSSCGSNTSVAAVRPDGVLLGSGEVAAGRRRRLGGRSERAQDRRRMGPAAGPGRPDHGRPRPAGRRASRTSSPSATSASPLTVCRSWRSPRYRAGCTPAGRSRRWSPVGRRSRSTTTTRARWPRSAGEPPSPTSRSPRAVR